MSSEKKQTQGPVEQAPTVSVIMPAYGAERTIGASIQSVLDQTFPDFELLVIYDCSPDGTRAVVEGLARTDSRIRLIDNPRNLGVAATRNRGVALARGEWIAFLDSDDLWHPEKLSRQLALLREHPDGVLSCTGSCYTDPQDGSYDSVLEIGQRITYRDMLHGNVMYCSSVMVKKTLIAQTPFQDGPIHEDYVVWMTLLRTIPAAYGLNEPLLTYRLSPHSRSGNRVRSAMMLIRSYRCLGYGWLRVLWHTGNYFLYSVRKRRRISNSQKRESDQKRNR